MTSQNLAATAVVDASASHPHRDRDGALDGTPPLRRLRPVARGLDGLDSQTGDATTTTSRRFLPDPEPTCLRLARCIVEILAGVRDLDQIARWVSDDVYRHVAKRVSLARRARVAHGRSAARPHFVPGPVRVCEPVDGIVEAVVVLHSRGRSRAVALRLEGYDGRWRASAVHVL